MRALIAWLASAAVAGLVCLGAARADVVVRTSLDPADGIVLGQRVNLEVDVLFPDRMPHPPRVTIADVPGAQIMQFASQGTTISARLDGASYVGKRFEFAVFPRRGGRTILPAARIALLDPSGGVIGSAQGQDLTMDVAVPPGIDASVPVIATDSLTVSQTWSPDPAQALSPGGALVRTVERQASDVPALAMTDFDFAAPDGVRVYVDPPQADDRVNRGTVMARRTDRVTYVFEKPGAYDLPALTQSWWNLETKSAESASLPGRTVQVSPARAASSSRAQNNPLRHAAPLIAAGLVLLVAVIVLLAFSGRLRARWQLRKEREAGSEAALRRDLCTIARTGEPAGTYRALKRWLDRLPSDRRSRTSAEVQALTDDLDSALFGDGPPWTSAKGAQLCAAVASRPGIWRKGAQPVSATLPPLNP